MKYSFIFLFMLLAETFLFSLSMKSLGDSTDIQYVIKPNVNLRAEASINSKVIGLLQKGDKLQILKKTNIQFTSENIVDNFYEVESSYGKGYVFGGYISNYSYDLVSYNTEYTLFSKLYSVKFDYPEIIREDIYYSQYHKIPDLDQDILKRWYTKSIDRDSFKNNYVIENYQHEPPRVYRRLF